MYNPNPNPDYYHAPHPARFGPQGAWQPQAGPQFPPNQPPRDTGWPPRCFEKPVVSIYEIQQLNLPVSYTEYATIGGGLGSFAWADALRVSGVNSADIAALGMDPRPYGHYGNLAHNSQIPDWERLRSNSESTPDNLWGWPGYALREMWGEFKRGHLGAAIKLWWQIFGEPTLTDTYTPRISDVFRSIDREAARIGWGQIFRYARVRAIRMTDDGRYVVAYSTRQPGQNNGPAVHSLHLAHYLHLAVGYPALQFLPDLQRYREETGDFKSVVNAYENHDHIYEHLRQHGGLVMLRGRGVVASRILQRIAEERRHNPNIGIIHLLRKPVAEGHRFGSAKRKVVNQFEFQPFNWPRGTWTGGYRKLLEKASPEERKKLLEQWGGTTTAHRKDWVEITRRGLREGWYQIVFGEVEKVERLPQGGLQTRITAKGEIKGQLAYAADFIIDATGLEAKANSNPLLADLIRTFSLNLNLLGRVQVENDFEVTGMANGTGRMYAAGSKTLGGPVAAADSFLGVQYAGLRSVQALQQYGAPGVKKLGIGRSISQWLKWARKVQP
jgi:pSer/pThr/pTyr-binding forkhead associated (FHA) protein